MSRCVAGNLTLGSPRIRSDRFYQPVKMKALRFFETSGYNKLRATQRNIQEDQYPQRHCCGNFVSLFTHKPFEDNLVGQSKISVCTAVLV